VQSEDVQEDNISTIGCEAGFSSPERPASCRPDFRSTIVDLKSVQYLGKSVQYLGLSKYWNSVSVSPVSTYTV